MKEDDEQFEQEFQGDLDDILGAQPFKQNLPPGQPFKADDIENLLNKDDCPEVENRQARQLDEKEVKVIGVYEHQEQGMPPAAFVLLRDNKGRQVLIWIGRFEAYAISVALEGATYDRPMTHDLLKTMLDRLGGKVDRIIIDDLWQETYYAKISVSTNGTMLDVDARPSDAIALALRSKAPIYMAESVLQQASTEEL